MVHKYSFVKGLLGLIINLCQQQRQLQKRFSSELPARINQAARIRQLVISPLLGDGVTTQLRVT